LDHNPTDLPVRLAIPAGSDARPFLVRLSTVLTEDSAPEILMARVLETLRDVPEIEAAWIARPGPDGRLVPRATIGAFAREQQDIARLADVVHGDDQGGPCARAWQSGRPEIIDDWRGDPSVARWQAGTGHLRYAAAAAVPLLGRAGHHSMLAMYSNTRNFFSTTWNAQVLAHLAAVIGNALENRQKHEALSRTQLLYQTLFTGADILLTARSEKTVLNRLCRTLVGSGLFVTCAVRQLDPDGFFRIKASSGYKKLRAPQATAFKYVKGAKFAPLSLRAWETGKTMVVNDFMRDPRFAPLHAHAQATGYVAVAAIPIRRGAARWAVLSVTAGSVDFFTDDLIHLLERMTRLVGHTLDELDLKATLRAEREAQSRIARQDALTLLPNRLAFQEQLAGAMARAVRHRNSVGIGMIDLDDFKQINDSFGHPAGDHVLRKIGQRLRAMLRECDFVARLGGDEFALILEDWCFTRDIEGFCKRLYEALHAKMTLPNGEVLNIAFSAGFTLFPADHQVPDQLVRHADMALYAAKAEKGSGASFWRLYRGEAGETSNQLRVRGLLQAGGLQLHYQPVISLDSGALTGFEALARLQDGDELVEPARFLPSLSLTDRNMLFRQVLDASLEQLHATDRSGLSLNVSVNLDAQVLLLDNTLPYIRQTLAKTGIAPGRLTLEILETHDFLDMTRALAQIRQARAHGVHIALDDLGSGYSSILKIRELPWDAIKLDRAFVAGLRERPDDLMFIAVLQTLTASLNMDLIVEGVESDDVLDAVRMVGARYAQGYKIARPMPAGAVAGWVRHHRPRPPGAAPQTLLGAYANHLNWLRLFDFWRQHENALFHLSQHDRFSLADYFAGPGQRHAQARDAYGTLQAILRRDHADRALVVLAAEHFRAKMIAALKAGG
jgi:diguanylate cyclase (GGDEF)-like protein